MAFDYNFKQGVGNATKIKGNNNNAALTEVFEFLNATPCPERYIPAFKWLDQQVKPIQISCYALLGLMLLYLCYVVTTILSETWDC